MSERSPEHWLAKKLGAPSLFAVGTTTFEDRRNLARDEIKKRGIADQICAHRTGEEITFSEAFEAIFGEPL